MRIYLVNEFRKRLKEIFLLVKDDKIYIKQRNNYFQIIFPDNQLELKGIYESIIKEEKCIKS